MIMTARMKFRCVSTRKGRLPLGQVLKGTVTVSHTDKAKSHIPILVFRNRKKDADNKKEASREAEKKGEAPETTRVFQFTIDCDYNKPRAEGDKPASTPQGK